MDLSNNLVSQFAKLTKNQNTQTEKTVYGTAVSQGGKLYVNIDGSDTITPVVTMSDIKPGERVSVLIKDHSATIIGNITNPSAGTEEMGKVLDEYDTIIAKIGNFELLIADKVTTEQLEAELAIIDEALIGKASVAELNAVKATIEDLEVNELRADIAIIEEALIQKADIVDLDATNAEIDILSADLAEINTLVGGQLTMDNIQSLVLTSSKVTVDNAFIKDAMIDRVSASKLTAGTINTSIINIGSEDGSMTISGSLQQFKDENGVVRIQIGKDANGDFTFVLYGEDGTGQLINQNGITASAIEDGLIVNDMVSETANIAGSKLDINSVIEEVNGSTTTIKSSKIILDDQNQTLDVAFSQMNTTVEENTEQIETNTTSISTAQGQIETLISNTTITNKDGTTVSMKDDYSSFKQTVDSMSSTIGSLETTVDETSSKMSTLEQTVDGFSSRISEAETSAESASSKVSELEQTVSGFEVRISDTETTTETLESDVATLKLSSEEFEVEIAKKTDKNRIISTINASTEGITISSSKINITGLVKFSDLSTAGNTTINGANITTGYISCSRLKGGTLSAADEINFIGGARIFGTEGDVDAGLTISAAGIVLGGGSVNYLWGSWFLSSGDLEIQDGDLVVKSGCKIDCYDIDATKIACTGITCEGGLTAGAITSDSTITSTGKISGPGSTALNRGSLWTPAGSAYRDHLQIGNHLIMSDSSSGKIYVTNASGNFTTIRGSRFEAGGDVTCWDLWASNKVYANNVALTSDISLKTDIKYVDVDTQTIGDSGLISPNVNITTSDMHSFIETLPMASYRMTKEFENGIDYTYYGFIAQDVLYSKVGSELIETGIISEIEEVLDEEGNVIDEIVTEREILRYSENKFIAFICGALKEEIAQRRELERKLDSLTEIVAQISNL